MKSKPLIALYVLIALGGVTYGAFQLFRPHNKGVIILMLDTTRADHLGVYGYTRNTTPNIDGFAKENVMFNYAVTAAPWTPPSVATMFTGLYPATHGWMPPNDRNALKKSFTKLEPELVTLAEVLKTKGYATAALSPNPWITEEFGYDQGFDSFWYKSRASADEIVGQGIKVIDSLVDSGKPFFLYMHFLDPHDPYNPPAEFKDAYKGNAPGKEYTEDLQKSINLYDGEISFMDQELGKFFQHLKNRGVYDDLSILLVADHGEQFMERGDKRDGHQLFNEEVHVPLIVKVARSRESRKVDATVSTVDLFPTILSLVGIVPSKPLPGVSLLDDKAIAEREGVFSEISRKIHQKAFTTPDGVKLIVQDNGEDGEQVLGIFNRRNDYLEKVPVNNQELLLTLNKELKGTYQMALDGRIQPETARGQLKDTTVEQLKSLGYLN